jgi:hypothetical protein
MTTLVVMTGYRRGDREHEEDENMFDYTLVKPLPPDDLADIRHRGP